MFAAYFDESSTHDQSRILTVSGVISHMHQWDRLAVAWQRLLDKSNVEKFHAKDLWGGYDDFAHLTDPMERVALYNKFVAIAARHVLWRTWSVLTYQDYLSFL